MDEKYLRSKARTKALLSVAILGGVLVAQVMAVVLVLVLQIPEESLWAAILPQMFSAAWAMAGVVILGGTRLVIPRRDEIRHAFRFGWLCIAVALALMAFQVFSYVSEGMSIDPQWPLKVAECALLCLGVGFHEEFVFRGIIFQSLLGLGGGTHKGVVRVVFISALIFGVMHIDVATDMVSPVTCVQAVLKVIQTGMFGILMCAITLRKRALTGASLLHGLDDFILMVVSIGLFSEPFETEYTTEGEEAISTIVLYMIVIALYLPFTIKSLREIRERNYVYRGEFMEREIARVREWERQRQEAELAKAQAAAEAGGALWAQGPVRVQGVPLVQVGPMPLRPAPLIQAGQGQVPGRGPQWSQGQVPGEPGQVPMQGRVPTGPYGPVRVQSVPLAQVQGQGQARVQGQMQGQAQGQASARVQGQMQTQAQAPTWTQGQMQGQAQAPTWTQGQMQGQAQGQASARVQGQARPASGSGTPPAPKGLG